jgi:hypothetical protein
MIFGALLQRHQFGSKRLQVTLVKDVKILRPLSRSMTKTRAAYLVNKILDSVSTSLYNLYIDKLASKFTFHYDVLVIRLIF